MSFVGVKFDSWDRIRVGSGGAGVARVDVAMVLRARQLVAVELQRLLQVNGWNTKRVIIVHGRSGIERGQSE